MVDNEKVEVILTPEEEKELREGQELYELTQSAGWKVIERWLQDRAFHSWVDPRTIDTPNGSSKDEWIWRELNAFHSADVAKQLLEEIQKSIGNAEYLNKVKSGEIKKRNFKI